MHWDVTSLSQVYKDMDDENTGAVTLQLSLTARPDEDLSSIEYPRKEEKGGSMKNRYSRSK